jgi:hypothetical protein
MNTEKLLEKIQNSEELKKLVEKVVEEHEEKQPKRILGRPFQPKKGDYVYWLKSNGGIGSIQFGDFFSEEVKQGNIFDTIEDAEFVREKRRVQTALQFYADEINEGWEPNWEDHGECKYILYHNAKAGFGVSYDQLIHQTSIYFKTSDLAWQAIYKFGDDLLYLFGIDPNDR